MFTSSPGGVTLIITKTSPRVKSALAVDETKIRLVVPEGIGLHELTDILRLFEACCCARAMSPLGEPAFGQAAIREFMTQVKGLISHQPGGGFGSVFVPSLPFFEEWIRVYSQHAPLFGINDIKHGSYDFVLQAVNLCAIFQLQDYAVLKDVVQWSVGVFQLMLRGDPSDALDIQPDPTTSIQIAPHFLRAMKTYDEVDLSEFSNGEGKMLVVRLRRRSSNYTEPKVQLGHGPNTNQRS